MFEAIWMFAAVSLIFSFFTFTVYYAEIKKEKLKQKEIDKLGENARLLNKILEDDLKTNKQANYIGE